jgi:hypothetical protein
MFKPEEYLEWSFELEELSTSDLKRLVKLLRTVLTSESCDPGLSFGLCSLILLPREVHIPL